MSVERDLFELIKLSTDRVTVLEERMKRNEDIIATLLKELREYYHNIASITKT